MNFLNKLFLLLSIISVVIFTPLAYSEPYVVDENFVVEKYVSGLNFPSSFLFLDDDILVLEKNTGKIRIIENGQLQPESVLQIEVDNRKEGGLLGITKSGPFVYLYYTTALDNNKENPVNQIWKYNFDGKSLTNGKLVKQMPAGLIINEHNGGAMTTGLDGMVYAVTGDAEKRGITQNFPNGDLLDTGIITKVNFDEKTIEPSKSENPFLHYQAIGIRNSFGLDVDPITGNLWDTENGHANFDEVNLVKPGFNSGWKTVMGPLEKSVTPPKINEFVYADPKFSWESTVAPTALTFIKSDSFENYKDYLLVGDFNTGTIYQFQLNKERDGFIFENLELNDLVLNHGDPVFNIIFSTGYQGISDLDFGPDGSLYVLSILDGTIYKISKQTLSSENNLEETSIFEKFFLFLLSLIQGPVDSSICDKPIESRVNLSNCFLEEKNFPNIDLKLSNFENTSIIKTNLKETDLRSTNLKNVKIENSDFSGANLHFSDLKNSIVKDSNFNKAKINNVNLENTQILNSKLIGSNLMHSNLKNAKIDDSDFSNGKFNFASMTFSQISESKGSGVDFFIANLTNSQIYNSDLNSSKFRFIHGKNAIWVNSDFSNSLFFGARLMGANMSNSNFINSDFSKSTLENTILTDTNFQDSNLSNSNLVNANMRGVNLKGANLDNANLQGADLSLANLSGASFNEANFQDAITKDCVGCPKNNTLR